MNMPDNLQPFSDAETSLFAFMLRLRTDPRSLAAYFPQYLTPEVLKGEPRNLSRELKGTPQEMTDFVVVYGFGESALTHVVAVSFMPGLLDASTDMTAEPSWAADHENLIKVYGLTPIVLALALQEGE
jgi:hypothetical protein